MTHEPSKHVFIAADHSRDPKIHESSSELVGLSNESVRLRSLSRPIVETLVVLFIGIFLFRTFVAEPYIVPTGSMAHTLLGIHRDYTCTSCTFRFSVGVDEHGTPGWPRCPNCGTELDNLGGVARTGDRLLVQKNYYLWRTPKRWEVVVFRNPEEPEQAFVKRVVGLPGESIEIRDGDVYVDGEIARKDDRSQRATRLLVHDSRFQPSDPSWFPRWVPRNEGGRKERRWERDGNGFQYRDGSGTLFLAEPVTEQPIDWLDYKHVDPERGRYDATIRDFIPYNGVGDRLGSGEAVHDLELVVELELGEGTRGIAVRFGAGRDELRLVIPLNGIESPHAEFGGEVYRTEPVAGAIASGWAQRAGRRSLDASFIDRRLVVHLDHQPLFQPLDLPAPRTNDFPRSLRESPTALGLIGGAAQVHRLRVYRDIYYTDGLHDYPGRAFGVGEPYQLGPDEYFVLGDNSPISNDSRFWPKSPVVHAEMLLGKPFLVHLPSQAVPLRVFGNETYWVPDLREIRYIR